MEQSKTAVIAVGGNSLIRDKQHEDVESQWQAVKETCTHMADMCERGWNIVITMVRDHKLALSCGATNSPPKSCILLHWT